MKRNLLFSTLALTLVALVGCAPATSVVNEPSPGRSSTTAPVVEQTQEEKLVVDVAGVSFTHDGTTETISYDQPAALKDLLTEVSGSAPAETALETSPGYASGMIRYDYGGILLVTGEQGPARIHVETAEFHGIPVTTADGIGVGSARSDVMSAGAREGFDENGDGIADWLNLGSVEVPGTQSLTTPGTTGVQFVLIGLDGDVVQKMIVPSDDFSDL